MNIRRIGRAIAAIGVACVVASCGGDGDVPRGTPDVPMVASLPSTTGGTISYGATKVVVPANVLESGGESISIAYQDGLPGPAPGTPTDNITQGSRTLVLTRSGSARFSVPVLVTLPVDQDLVQTEVPVVLYWDPALKRYLSMEVVDVDKAAATVSFLTSHFSAFTVWFVGTIDILAAASAETVPAFQLGADGFRHPNISTYNFGGTCYGVVAFAQWYFDAKNAGLVQGPLFSRFDEGDPSDLFDDQNVREIFERTYNDTKEYYGKVWSDELYVRGEYGFTELDRLASDAFAGQQLLAHLKVTKSPVILNIRGPRFGIDTHVLLVYKFDANTRQFTAYDPNAPSPGAPVVFSWSPLTGFSDIPGYPNWHTFWTHSGQTWYNSSEVAAILSDAEKNSLKLFDVLHSSNLQAANYSTYCIASLDASKCYLHLSVAGNPIDPKTVSEGEPIPTSQIYIRNGATGAMVPSVALDDSDHAVVELSSHDLVAGSNDIQIGVAASGSNLSLGKIWSYRAYARMTVVPAQLDFNIVATGNAGEFQLEASLGAMPLTGAEDFRWTFSDGVDVCSGAPTCSGAHVVHKFPAGVPASATLTLVEDGEFSAINPTATHDVANISHYRFSSNNSGIDDELLVEVLDPDTATATTIVHAFFGPKIADVDFVAKKGQKLRITAIDYNGGGCYGNGLMTLKNLDDSNAAVQTLERAQSSCTFVPKVSGNYNYISDVIAIEI